MDVFDPLRTPPHVTLANFYPFRPGEVAGTHWSESNLFLPVTSGRGEVRVGPQRFQLQQGQILHVPWAAPVRYQADARDPFVLIGLHFKYLSWSARATPSLHTSVHVDALKSSMQKPPVPQPFSDAFVFTPPPQSRIFDTAVAIGKAFEHERLRKSDPDSEARLRALALEFVVLVRDHRRGSREPAPHPQAGVVAELMSYIDLSYRNPIKRSELAARAGMSESSLAAAFRAVTGRAPIDYLIDLRLAHARTLLSNSRQRVNEIAEQVGIPDVYYFSKLFKRRHDLSPLQYRKQRQASWPLTKPPIRK
jgi:AraC-like DNA-binding protein